MKTQLQKLMCLVGFVLLVSASSCKKDDPKVVIPTAGFTTQITGLKVKFTNTSSGGATYLWSFGDNTTSAEVSPEHTYSAAGTYTVNLKVTSPTANEVVSVRSVIVTN